MDMHSHCACKHNLGFRVATPNLRLSRSHYNVVRGRTVLLGWFIDDIVVFLFRTIVMFVQERRGRNWPTSSATVIAVYESTAYPNVQLVYKYVAAGETWIGIHTRGFWLADSAKLFANQFRISTDLTVRYEVGDPSKSVVLRSDQVSPSLDATAAIKETSAQ